MKHAFSLLFIISALATFAQKKEQYFDYTWKPTEDLGKARYISFTEKVDSVWTRQDFFLREKKLQMIGAYQDKENKIAVGKFQFYHSNGALKSTGEYINGKKHGLWLSFYDDGMMEDSTVYHHGRVRGTSIGWHRNGYPSDSAIYNPDGSGMAVYWFDNGAPSAAGVFAAERKQQGKWKYYHRNGNISSVEIYDKGKLLSKEYFSEDGKAENDTTSKDRDASFPGGTKAWEKYVYKNLYFPEQWKIKGADAVVVIVDWVVDEEGNIKDIFVSSPFHPNFDKIAVDVIKRSPKWIPAISHNRRVKAYRRLPVTFDQNPD